MRIFKVCITEREGDKTGFDMIFKTQSSMASFLANMDMDKYDLSWIDTVENYVEDTEEFLRKTPGLETGKQ